MVVSAFGAACPSTPGATPVPATPPQPQPGVADAPAVPIPVLSADGRRGGGSAFEEQLAHMSDAMARLSSLNTQVSGGSSATARSRDAAQDAKPVFKRLPSRPAEDDPRAAAALFQAPPAAENPRATASPWGSDADISDAPAPAPAPSLSRTNSAASLSSGLLKPVEAVPAGRATPRDQGTWHGVPFVSPGPGGHGPPGKPPTPGGSPPRAVEGDAAAAGKETPRSLMYSELKLLHQEREGLEAQLLKVKGEAYQDHKALKKDVAAWKAKAEALEASLAAAGRDAAALREREAATRAQLADAAAALEDSERKAAGREQDVRELEAYLKQLAERAVAEEQAHAEWKERAERAEAGQAEAGTLRAAHEKELARMAAAVDVAAKERVEVAHTKAAAAERLALIDKLQRLLEERTADAHEKATVIAAQEKKLAALEEAPPPRSTSAGDARVAQLEKQLAERDREAGEQAEATALLEASVRDLRGRLADVAREKAEVFTEEQLRLANDLRATLDEQNAALAALAEDHRSASATVDAQRERIAGLEHDVDVKAGAIKSLKLDLAAQMRAASVRSASASAASDAQTHQEKDDTIARLAASLAEAVEKAQREAARVAALEAEAAQVRAASEKGRVEDLLAAQGAAMQRDTLVLSLKDEVASLRTRHAAVLKEKDLLMRKLVQERAKADAAAPPRSGSGSVESDPLSYAATSASGFPRRRSYFSTHDAGCQTPWEAAGGAPPPPPPQVREVPSSTSASTSTSPVETLEELLRIPIDGLKAEIDATAKAAKQHQRALLEASYRVGNLRDALQQKLEKEMKRLSSERSRHAAQQKRFEAGLATAASDATHHLTLLADMDRPSPISCSVSPAAANPLARRDEPPPSRSTSAAARAAAHDAASVFSLSPMGRSMPSPSSWGDDLFAPASTGAFKSEAKADTQSSPCGRAATEAEMRRLAEQDPPHPQACSPPFVAFPTGTTEGSRATPQPRDPPMPAARASGCDAILDTCLQLGALTTSPAREARREPTPPRPVPAASAAAFDPAHLYQHLLAQQRQGLPAHQTAPVLRSAADTITPDRFASLSPAAAAPITAHFGGGMMGLSGSALPGRRSL